MPFQSPEPPKLPTPVFERRQVIDPWKEWGISKDSLDILVARDSLVHAQKEARESELSKLGQDLAQAQRRLDKTLTKSLWLQGEEPGWREGLFEGAKKLDLAGTIALDSLLNAKELSLLNLNQRRDLIDIFKVLGPKGRTEITSVLKRPLPQNRGSSVLLDLDAWGNTLLDNIHALCFSPLDFRIGLENENLGRRSVALSILREVGKPASTTTLVEGSCTAITLISDLKENNPAELVRIVQGLLSPNGIVVLKGGARLVRVPDAFAALDTKRGEPDLAEFILTTSLLDYGVKPNAKFSASQSRRISSESTRDTLSHGLLPEEYKRLISAVYGREYKLHYGKKALELLYANERYPSHSLPTMISMVWRPVEPKPVVFGPQLPIPVSELRLSHHAIKYIGRDITADEILVFDPSDTTRARGRADQAPPRRILDPEKHLASFRRKDFESRLDYALIPEPTFNERIERLVIDFKNWWSMTFPSKK